jgi:GNAT superfamily N-acetyltransferase
MDNFIIERACEQDATSLTRIAFAAKRHWKYPEEYFTLWEKELTVNESYLNENLVFKVIKYQQVVGFYSLVNVQKEFYSGEIFIREGWWLDHLFILPEFHKQGFGTALLKHALVQLQKQKAVSCFVFVDPFASGFYEKSGAEFLYHSPSSIKGRSLPVYEMKTR